MRTTRLDLAYDGTAYQGWAYQHHAATIEGELTRALRMLHQDLGDVVVAGRTDTGVHATGQVVSVTRGDGPPVDALPRALNDALPPDIAVLGAREMPDDFSARFSARSRSYVYSVATAAIRDPLMATRELHEPRPLDRAMLDAMAEQIVGTHDFRAFTPTETQHRTFERTVHEARWVETDRGLAFHITANAFLRHMVRTLVGTMIETARGDQGTDPAAFGPLLAGAERSDAGWTAPPHGLCLVRVGY